MSQLSDKIALTGIKPTGTPHIGNLVGAIRPVVDMSKEAKSTLVFIADLHSLNTIRDSSFILDKTYEIAATFLAFGIDPEKTILFRQSDVPEVCQMANLLMNVTPKGLMNRGHAYKAVTQKNKEQGEDIDSGVNMGLFTYPVLMAADILLYGADVVPVGMDQKQHVEFARDIAGSFNHIYKTDTLVIPEPIIQEDANEIPGLDGRKMSKSYDNYIPIFAEEKALKKMVMRIITDSKKPEEPKDPETSSIFQLYRIFASVEATEALKARFLQGGMGYGEAKTLLFDELNNFLKGPREKYNALMSDKTQIDAVLDRGAQLARHAARKTLEMTSKAMLGRSIASRDLGEEAKKKAPSDTFSPFGR